MAIISARINDDRKAEAEEIANKLGLSLSNVINVFLTKFIAEKGFPFKVTVENTESIFNQDELQNMVIKAIKNNTSTPDLPKSVYIDSEDNKIKITK